jgi:integrase
MTSLVNTFPSLPSEWQWPLDCTRYDRSPFFTETERQEIAVLAARTGGPGKQGGPGGSWPHESYQVLQRLLQPLYDVCYVGLKGHAESTKHLHQAAIIRAFLREMDYRQAPYWAWEESTWIEFIAPSLEQFNTHLGWSWAPRSHPQAGTRLRVLLAAYLFGVLPDPRKCGDYIPTIKLATLVFGKEHLDAAFERVVGHLSSQGYSLSRPLELTRAICAILLLNRSPFLEEVTDEQIQWIYQTENACYRPMIAVVARALTALGLLQSGIEHVVTGFTPLYLRRDETVPAEWENWCKTWRSLSTLEPTTTQTYYTNLLEVGRWLQKHHPDITSPTQWTALFATECVASLIHWNVGEYSVDPTRLPKCNASRLGQPMAPHSIHGLLSTLRRFFKDLQESEHIPLHFNPDRYLRLPRSVRQKIGPKPRVIDRALWAKLVWAGQHLEQDDLPSTIYPLEMVRAVAAVWLFTALRSDEICRLCLGCIEWPETDIVDPETGKRVNREQVCYLHIPANKTAPAFKKPVAPYVGKMIAAWEAVRPPQELALDRKSAEQVRYLFSMRGHRLGKAYINTILIPLLAAKANVPPLDQRGRVTSHRARATIATFLGNCENPMSLWQLMRWLGHRTEETTRYYVDADMTKVAVKVAEGSFLQQNLASIPVLIDNDAVMSGAASSGQPWKYFDLGHGYCTLPEWAACRHRMACAKCDFYQPKHSTKMQLLEANGNLTRMLEFVALGDEERKLIEQGITLNQALLSRLADEPTPAGPTPRELQSGKRKPLPVLTQTVGLVEPESRPHDEDGEEQEEAQR